MELLLPNVFDIYAILIEDDSKCIIAHFDFVYSYIIPPSTFAHDVDILFL